MNKIKIMDELLANKIAAGEVIERPLSVIKELMENSIDAGAKIIKIKLIDSGLEEIQVNDDGEGMSKEDLRLSIRRHATSKLHTDEDLYRITTLGFRGEALPSIFSVSKLEIFSSIDGKNGHHLIKTTETDFEIKETSFNKGTSIIVKNLFYNTPVRYKHLSNLYYELSLIIKYVQKMALIHTDISFEIINNEQQLFYTSGNNNFSEVMLQVYNFEIANSIIHSEIANDHFSIMVNFVKPQHTRSKKDNITIAINERLIKNYQIEQQIIKSYGKFLHTNQYPIAVLQIKMKHELIDVNIHPTKQQVKISLLNDLLQLIDSAISNELKAFEYISTPVFENQNQDLNSKFKEMLDTQMLAGEEVVNVETSYEYQTDNSKSKTVLHENEQANLFDSNDESNEKIVQRDKIFESEEVIDNYKQSKLPMLNYIGQLQKTYLLFENEQGLYLVDQHAAKERINYELIFDKFKNKNFIYQQLLFPISIDISLGEMELLKNKLDRFMDFGLKVEEFGIDKLRVTEADSFLLNQKFVENDFEHIKEIILDKKEEDFSTFYESVAIMMSCKRSVKANQIANSAEAYDLIKELGKAKVPYTCPHGRPVIVKLTNYEIEKLFKRNF